MLYPSLESTFLIRKGGENVRKKITIYEAAFIDGALPIVVSTYKFRASRRHSFHATRTLRLNQLRFQVGD